MDSIKGLDKKVTWQFMDLWKNCWVSIDWVFFEVIEELISNAMGLVMESRRWRKHPRVMDETSLQKFLHSNEGHVCLCGGFARENLLE